MSDWKPLTFVAALAFIAGIVVQREFSIEQTQILLFGLSIVVAYLSGEYVYRRLSRK